MNIVGENFPQPIINQINTRQKKKGLISRNIGNDPTLLTWMNSNTGWVRAISSVDVNSDRYSFKNAPLKDNPLYGSDLARKYILFGGVSNGTGLNGLHSGISTDQSIHNSNAYGLGGSKEFGIVPMPGITSFNIKTENRGSLKTATIGIKAYNRTQFDIISTLYLSLGYSILIEWGNTMFWKSDDEFEPNNPYSLANDFLNGIYKWDDILPEITKNRLASKGNYDAALGKVVNFSWTVDRDLSYNITLTVRTIGDIIESLKVNILTGNVTLLNTVPKTDNTNPTSQDPITDFAKSSDIGAIIYNLQTQLNNTNITNPEKDGACVLYDSNTKAVQAIKQTYETKNDAQYYIRLGYFLEILQNSIIPDVLNGGNKPKKYIKFDTNIDSNLISLYFKQLSADPSICLFNTSYPLSNGQEIKILPKGDQFKFYFDHNNNNVFYGKFMNVYFNMNYIIKSLTQLIDNDGKIILIDFLKQLCYDFCRVTGNYNKIEPTINEETNQITFIDDVPIPGYETLLKKINPTSPPESAFFVLYGIYPSENGNLAGIVRDLNLTTTITPQLASLITIGAQANAYITGQDSTGLSSINKGLTDRVKQEIVDSSPSSNPSITDYIGLKGIVINSTTPPPSLETKYANQINAFNIFVNTLGSINGSTPKWDQNAIDNFKNVNIAFAEYDQYSQTRIAQLNNPSGSLSSPTIGFLPFGLTLTIDGLSGMKVYQKYNMDTNFLPSNYPESLQFLIKGISHEIKNNQWTTTLESFAIPKNPFSTQDTPITANNRVQGPSPIIRGNFYKGANVTNLNVTTSFLNQVLKGIGITNPNPSQTKFMLIWRQVESGQAAWNPLNTSLKTQESLIYNTDNVQNYPNQNIGIKATIDTLKEPRYTNIVSSIKNIKTDNNIKPAMQAVQNSRWGTTFPSLNYLDYKNITNFIYSNPIINK